MSKKIMKRSLALGALMAFVITGSAMTAEASQNLIQLDPIVAQNKSEFMNKSFLEDCYGTVFWGGMQYHWCYYYPGYEKNFASEDSNKLVTTGDITYTTSEYGGNFGLFAGFSNIANTNEIPDTQKYANPDNNILEVKHSIESNGEMYLYGSFIDQGTDVNSVDKNHVAENNYAYVGVEDKEITLQAGSNIYIGGALGNGNSKDDLENNHVEVNNVKFDTDASVTICGGEARNGSAKSNTVSIKDTTITKAVIYGGYSGNGSADGNTVNIEGNSKIVSQESQEGQDYGVYGGYSANGSANNNTVNIKGNVDISGADLYGSNKEGSTGNTLNISADWSNNKIKSVNNFNTINIEEAQWGTPAVNVTGTLALTDTVVNVGTVRVAGGNSTYGPGATSTLITADNEINGNVSADSSVSVFKGVATIYDATIEKSTDKKAINIVLGDASTAKYNPEMNPQVLVIGESRAAATAFTNQGSELIETGLNALARDEAEDTKAFATVYGNASEFATGSHVKVNGWSGIVGVGKTNANGLTMGAFFENGEGNYRTYNNVNGDFMRGDGDACYNGGGFIIRKDNTNGIYTEASLRAGNLQNELRNAVRGSEGLAGYDIDTFYYGAHIGVGKIIPRGTEGDSIDVYGKFVYTHHDSEDFTIDGDKFHFDSVDSERLRLGFRINEVQTNKLSMYYGAAWEYEFGGDADNTVVGYDLSTPSLEGSTVIGEVGMHYNASEKWSLDLNVRGYGGQREGFSGSVQANYMF